jgi:RNA polymerase sigma-70 factor (ECF subfamily)
LAIVQKHRTISEEDLIRSLRGSKREAESAFAEVYSRYAHRTYAFILRMTGERTVSQDLLQETFIKFFRATKEDLVFRNISAFLLMIARNLCLNWRRDHRETLELEESILAPDNYSVERDDLLHLVTLALELLDFEQREAFVLKYYQGYTYDEMSQITGETIPALKNRVWRAKEKIRAILRPCITELQR